MTNVIQHEPAQLPTVQPESTTVLSIISKAASDPSVDIDKLERLMQMHERMQARTAEQEFNAAMAQMQCEIPTVFEGAVNLHTKKSYATLDDINRTLKPVMQRHGFAITFKVEQVTGGLSITGILMHRAGHREQTSMVLPIDKGAGRNDVQAVGSSTTYGKRYVMCALLNITTGDQVDDDAQSASGSALAEDWIFKASNALTADDLSAVWRESGPVFKKAGDLAGYAQLKEFVEKRLEHLKQSAKAENQGDQK
jgi:hypothetical protein